MQFDERRDMIVCTLIGKRVSYGCKHSSETNIQRLKRGEAAARAGRVTWTRTCRHPHLAPELLDGAAAGAVALPGKGRLA